MYLEAIKPIINGTDEAAKQQTINTLFYVIESGMRLLHPMMPFLSEELFQKLPGFEGKTESICVNEYPKENAAFDNPAVEADFTAINNISKTIRSLIANVNLPKSAHPACYALLLAGGEASTTEALAGLITAEAKLISTLTKTSSVRFSGLSVQSFVN